MLTIVLSIVFVMLFVSLVLTVYRLIQGPTLADRVVALDLVGMLIAGIVAAYAVLSADPVYLDALVILALFMFFGTVAFARYLEKRALK